MTGPQIRDKLVEGSVVRCKLSGNSMTPIIRHGDEVTIEPLKDKIEKGDIVFCYVRGSFMLHKVSAVRVGSVQISNNHGRVNGWTTLDKVYGKFIR